MKQLTRKQFFASLVAPFLAALGIKSDILETVKSGLVPGWNGFVRVGPSPPGSIVAAGNTMYWLNTKYLKFTPRPRPELKPGPFVEITNTRMHCRITGIGR